MRLRSVCLTFLLAAVPWLATTAHSEPPVEVFAPVTPEEAAIMIQPPGSLAGASALAPAAKCHPTRYRASIVALEWQVAAGEGTSAQRVDISKFREGFTSGRYDTTVHLSAATSGVSVEAPEPGINYYWRVLTKSPNGWVSSPVSRFEVPVCPWDEPAMSAGEAASGSAAQRPASQRPGESETSSR